MKSRVQTITGIALAALSLAVIVALVLVPGEGTKPPEDAGEIQPAELTHRVYLPLVASNYPNKFGVALGSSRCIVAEVNAFYARGWYPTVNHNCPDTVVQMPCVCRRQAADDVLSGAATIEAEPGGVVLSVNEPELWEQAHTSPDAWAVYQHLLMRQFPQFKWASPAIVISPQWLQSFVDVYRQMYPDDPFPFAVLDWHCYKDTAAECIAQADEMLALMDAWNAQGAGIEYAMLSEFGLSDTAEMLAFVRWIDREPRIQRALIFTSELRLDDPFSVFGLGEYGSDPLVLTERGEAFNNR